MSVTVRRGTEEMKDDDTSETNCETPVDIDEEWNYHPTWKWIKRGHPDRRCNGK